jgi:pimeloyl-ACP methyl ester carboxylesterase
MTEQNAAIKPSRSEFLHIRGLKYHIRHWGSEHAPMLVMLHGWMDTSASFQFVVDALQRSWHVIAPDWRGFGLSANSGTDTYWFPDYLGDLDAILLHYSPDQPVNLLGHSMGGNVACLYAGVRHARVKKLINLEGFGMPVSRPEQAPVRYAQWLDDLHEPAVSRAYATLDDVKRRLQKNNPRLSDARADFLARNWAVQNENGEWEILGDPVHKHNGPLLYHVEDVMACWQKISAPVLWVEATETDVWRWMGQKDKARIETDRRIQYIPDVKIEMIPEAGHMLHHDQPQLLAEMIERFLA